ncbi:MAG: hypothetical protein IJ713_01225 [Oscillibacter sp.]|nr:hypothetical protein [Oscillibacter sp.]
MKEHTMSRVERYERAQRLRKAKAIVITVVLLIATVTALAVLWQWERPGFEIFLWAFGVIGFVRVMMVLATWIDELTIDQDKPNYQDWAAYRGEQDGR